MDKAAWERDISERDEIIRLQAEHIAALERELAELKMLLKEKADDKRIRGRSHMDEVTGSKRGEAREFWEAAIRLWVSSRQA